MKKQNNCYIPSMAEIKAAQAAARKTASEYTPSSRLHIELWFDAELGRFVQNELCLENYMQPRSDGWFYIDHSAELVDKTGRYLDTDVYNKDLREQITKYVMSR